MQNSPWLNQMNHWLATTAVTTDGIAWSWVNPANPGYAYPEIVGYSLTYFSQYQVDKARAAAMARWLLNDLGTAGAVGRGDIVYLFDTGMALTGLINHFRQQPTVAAEVTTALHNSYATLARQIRARTGIWHADRPAQINRHWSDVWGPHQVKLAISLIQAHQYLQASDALELANQVIDDILPQFDNGRFRTFTDGPECQLHAHCYAIEGLISCNQSQLFSRRFDDVIHAAADWLASIQNADGSVSEWHDGQTPSGMLRADVTSQAMRIWSIVDKEKYLLQIQKAALFLNTLRHPSGGLRFRPEVQDVNTWCTLFASQALKIFKGHSISVLV